MRKTREKPKKKWKGIPTALNYWEGWAILKKDPSTNKFFAHLPFPNVDEDTSKEKDFKKHHLKITAGDINYICNLISESPFNLDDPTLKDWLPIWEKRWSSLAAFGNKEAKGKLDRLHKAMQPCLKGKTSIEELKEIVDRDISLYKEIVVQKEKEGKPIAQIIATALSRESNYWVGENRAWEVYKAYNKLSNKCLPVLNGWENFFVFLNVCKEAIDSPVCISIWDGLGFIFAKGEVNKDRLVASY